LVPQILPRASHSGRAAIRRRRRKLWRPLPARQATCRRLPAKLNSYLTKVEANAGEFHEVRAQFRLASRLMRFRYWGLA
jgi:hypothetical protein